MMKHLIYLSYPINIRSGGPAGYLANLQTGINNCGISHIDFFSLSIQETFWTKIINKFFNILDKLLYHFKIYSNFRTKMVIDNYLNKKLLIPQNIDQYSSIHFHLTLDLFLFYHQYGKYLSNKKILLTSHSPELPCDEITAYFRSNKFLNQEYVSKFYKTFYNIDKFSFNLADSIIFPSKYSIEPYLINDEIKEVIQNKNLQFLLTGTKPLYILEERNKYRNKYNILEDEFTIGYIGRHNEIKGYDIFKQLATSTDLSDVKFLVAGDEFPLKAPNVNNWIEIGRINDVGSFLNSVDILIVPNRQTYFDLIILEAISLGTIVLTSNTGGNKEFYNKSIGIDLVDDYWEIKSWVNKILSVKIKSHAQLCEMRESNIDLYNKFFTVNHFAQNYNKLIFN